MNKLLPIVALTVLPFTGIAQQPKAAPSKGSTPSVTNAPAKAVKKTLVQKSKVAAIPAKTPTIDTVVKKKIAIKKTLHKQRKPLATSTEETIELNSNNTKTVVEIANGKVMINGEVVSTIDHPKTDRHRIVINHKEEQTLRQADADEVETYTHRPMLGVYTEKNKDYEGAFINSVVKNSPADEAGLTYGDVITRINGKEIHDNESLVDIINDYNGGERITINYSRNGREYHREVVLASSNVRRRHQTYEYSIPDLHGERRFPTPYLHSFLFNNIDDDFEYSPQLGIEAQDAKNGSGVMVVHVKEGTPAQQAGIKEGDQIIRLDNIRTRSVDDIQDVLNDTWPNQRITVEFKRDGVLMFAYIRFSKQKIKKDL